MEIKELKETILVAKEPKWFENIQMRLDFPVVKTEQTFDNFSALYLFIQKQCTGWSSFETIPPKLEASETYFEQVKAKLEQLIEKAKSYDRNQLNANIQQIKNMSRNHVFTYDCPETEFLIRINTEQPEYNLIVFEFLIKQQQENASVNLNNSKQFIGSLLAYEFVQRDFTKITERRNNEKSSLSRLRNDFEKYLNESENQLNQFLKESKAKSESNAKELDEIKDEKKLEFEGWFDETKNREAAFANDAKSNIENIENTYKDLLSLKAPAKYWNLRATKLKKQGNYYMFSLVGLSIIAAIFIFCLINNFTDETFQTIFKDTALAVKWSVLFISMVSLLAFGLRILSKAMFSAFHLARDAEEREQLTYLYLALKKDGNVEEEDRKLILQALFSRSDTGLLKEDSSPTMPSNISSIITKGLGK